MNVTTDSDFFNGLFENRPSKIFFMAISILLILLASVLCYSVIWYERFGLDAKRTIINQLFALHCSTAIEFMLFVTLPEWIRFVSGPGPKLLCWIHLVIKNYFVTKFLLVQTGIIIARYACIFWLKNPSAFNDEFWCYFINVWINLCSFILHFALAYSPGRQHVGYHICIGGNPAWDYLEQPKFNYIHHVIGVAGLAAHIPMSIRIYWFKHKRKNIVSDLVNATKNSVLMTIEKNSLSNFGSITLSMVCSAILGYLFSLYSNLAAGDLNNYPNYLLVYWIQLINGPLTIILVLALCYARNEHIRIVMGRETREFWSRHF